MDVYGLDIVVDVKMHSLDFPSRKNLQPSYRVCDLKTASSNQLLQGLF